MKICLVSLASTQSFPDINCGGAQSCVENFAQSLFDLGKDFFVVCPKRSIKYDYPFEVIETSSCSNNEDFISDVAKICEEKQPDIFLVNGFWAVKPLLKFDKPIICTVHCGIISRDGSKLIKHKNVYYRFISKDQYNTWTETDWDKEHNFQVYTGVSKDKFLTESTIKSKNNYFLWVSSLQWPDNTKGIYDFIRIAKMNPDYKFLAYGSGDSKREKSLKMESFEVPNFGFMGHLSRENNQEVFYNARATLFLSNLRESFGRVVLESLSAGTPVFSYKIPAVMEQIKPFCGKCCENLFEISDNLDLTFDRNRITSYTKEKFSSEKEIEEIFAFVKSKDLLFV